MEPASSKQKSRRSRPLIRRSQRRPQSCDYHASKHTPELFRWVSPNDQMLKILFTTNQGTPRSPAAKPTPSRKHPLKSLAAKPRKKSVFHGMTPKSHHRSKSSISVNYPTVSLGPRSPCVPAWRSCTPTRRPRPVGALQVSKRT
jgi:hypothetical protein